MSHELSTTTSASHGDVTFFDNIRDPLAFVTEIGSVFHQSGACGCKSPAEGKFLALACMCERISPFELQRRYHLMDGKLSPRAEVMLADFRRAGGSHRWIKDGSDGQSASLELTEPNGTKTVVSYSIEDAKQAKIFREGSGWTKNPANMLRARCSSNGVRMLMPELVHGLYTPEENDDMAAESRNGETRTAMEISTRQAELQAMAAGKTEAEEVIDVVPESAPVAVAETKTTDDVPFDVPDEKISDTVYLQIDSLLKKIGKTREEVETQIRAANPSFGTISDLTESQASSLLANIQKKIEADTAK